MRRDIAERWVARLEDPNVKQTDGALARELDEGVLGYCCLGVLCELAVEDGVVTRQQNLPGSAFSYGTREEFADRLDESGVLPDSVRAWAGLDEGNPYFKIPVDALPDSEERAVLIEDEEETVERQATELNDDYRFTFPQIASYIREKYLA